MKKRMANQGLRLPIPRRRELPDRDMVQIRVHREVPQKAAPLPSNWPTCLKEIEVRQKLLVSLEQDTAFHICHSTCISPHSLETASYWM